MELAHCEHQRCCRSYALLCLGVTMRYSMSNRGVVLRPASRRPFEECDMAVTKSDSPNIDLWASFYGMGIGSERLSTFLFAHSTRCLGTGDTGDGIQVY